MDTEERPKRCCIIERRDVEFSDTAVLQAIFATPAVAGSLALPPSRPEMIRFLPAANAVELQYGPGAEPASVSIGANALGALLVAYCIRAGIVLPRAATKSVCVIADAAILRLRLEFEALPALDTRRRIPRPESQPRRMMSWSDRTPDTA